MAEHLLTQSISREKMDLAHYYQRSPAPVEQDLAIKTFASLIAAGHLSRDEALGMLVGGNIDRALSYPSGNAADTFALMLAAGRMSWREIESIGNTEAVTEAIGRLEREHGRLTVRLDKATAWERQQGMTIAEPRQDMHPGFASLLGLSLDSPPSKDEIANLLNGKRADGEAIPRKQMKKANAKQGAIGFIDLCWSADKSFSVAWAFAPTEAERAMVWGWHRDAVEASMLYVEEVLGQARRGKAGRSGREAGHVAWMMFDHYTARPTIEIATRDKQGREYTEIVTPPQIAGDPQLHTHVAVPNVVLTDSEHVGGLDLNRLNGRVHEFGAYYQAQLATFARRAGADVVLDKETGAARLASIPSYVREAFSKRTRDAEGAARAFAAGRGMDWDRLPPDARIDLLKAGAKETRRGKADDMSDFEAWAQQAKEMGWQHRSVLRPDEVKPMADAATRADIAYDAALPLFAEKLERRSVVTGEDARVLACQGMIASGIESPRDIDRVTRAFRERGVLQDGQKTELVWAPDPTRKRPGPDKMSITTALHESQERELIGLAQAAAADKRGALTPKSTAEAVARSGLDFSGDHGRAQLSALERVARGGRLGLVIGVAGSGKSALLTPLVDAWKREGREVYGVALAWRQTEDMAGAGIDQRHALHGFLMRAKAGQLALDQQSVVAVDEIGQVGTRQLLDLMRLQAKHGFRIVAFGDDHQCQAIEAGPVIDLLRRALGPEAVPEILSTVRQKAERERKIAGLFREGRAEDAIRMKREDGTVRLVPGSYRDVVEHVAALWAARMEANKGDPGFRISFSVPTNMEARDISAAIRERRRQAGELGPDQRTIHAEDQAGRTFKLPLAVGDRIRLFKRVNGTFLSGTKGNIGNNGSVVEVREISDAGMILRNAKGNEARVKWDTLRHPQTGRVMLTYGDVLSIDAIQGATSTEHINAMPRGSAAVNGFKGYVAESRHRVTSWMVVSDGAERREITERRPLNDPRPIREGDVWENVARNLSRQPEKDSAVAMRERVRSVQRSTIRGFQAAMQRVEARAQTGRGRWGAGFTQARAARAAERVAEALGARSGKWDATMEQIARLNSTVQAMTKRLTQGKGQHL